MSAVLLVDQDRAVSPAGRQNREATFLAEARAKLVEAVVAGRLDAEQARAIFTGLKAHVAEIVAHSGSPPPAAAA